MNRRELFHLVTGIMLLALMAGTIRLLAANAGEAWYLTDFFKDHHHPQKPGRVVLYRLQCRGPNSFGATALVRWTPSGAAAAQVVCNGNNEVQGQMVAPHDAADLHAILSVQDIDSSTSNICTGDVPAGTGPGQFDHPGGWLMTVTCTLSPTEAVLTISIPRLYLPVVL